MSVISDLAALTGDCPNNQYGEHSWLPWLQITDRSWVTRCLRCGRDEQFDLPVLRSVEEDET